MNNHVGLEKRLFTPQRSVHVIGISRRDLLHCALLFFLFALGILWAQEALLELWFLIIPGGSSSLLETSTELTQGSQILAALSLLILISGRWLPERWTPVKYFARFWALTTLLVAVYGVFSKGIFLSEFQFTQFMLRTSLFSFWSLLLMLALGFYVLPFSFIQKFNLSVMVLAHNAITCWALTALCLQLPPSVGPLLYPVLCLLLGPLLHFAWFIGFYTWALTWRRRL